MARKPRIGDPDALSRAAAAKARAQGRAIALPDDFIRHDGGACPVEPDSYVEPIIRTAQGFGSGGVTLARAHFWEADKHDGGHGAIVAYRPAQRGEESTFDPAYRFKLKGIK